MFFSNTEAGSEDRNRQRVEQGNLRVFFAGKEFITSPVGQTPAEIGQENQPGGILETRFRSGPGLFPAGFSQRQKGESVLVRKNRKINWVKVRLFSGKTSVPG